MAEFLSADWFRNINEVLKAGIPTSTSVWRVVFEWPDGPSSAPHAMTLSCLNGVASIGIGDHLAADALVTLTFADARALATGSLDVADALRTGRFKLRGDAKAVVEMANTLRGAFA
ncbi:unannotated protein [freshwater metagenome]|uniref:Unannotated protein n=1 Tax=freshwater metagenome TaxID=449393 RepID=A0A6J7DZQ8_9ZZZZ|nr:SCP2 sterol-binding domain-containing protein [Actinomycetota bacterium]MUH58465.1 hypothetical protein [Actinomycetota bacterium]